MSSLTYIYLYFLVYVEVCAISGLKRTRNNLIGVLIYIYKTSRDNVIRLHPMETYDISDSIHDHGFYLSSLFSVSVWIQRGLYQ